VVLPILGETRSFDETALTDMAILCYYAYSSLYTGSPDARDILLQPYRDLGQCGVVPEFSVSATLQSRMFAGVPAPLLVTVNDRNGAIEGASIAVTAEGGSAGGGVTDAAGLMESSAIINADADLLTLTITISVDGEVVGERVLQAQRALPAIAAGTARVPCCYVSNTTSGHALGPPGGTLTSANGDRTVTWTLDPGVPAGEPTFGSLHRFTATGRGVQVTAGFRSQSTSDDDPTYLSVTVPRNEYRLLYWPSGIVNSGDCVHVAGTVDAFCGGQLVPAPGNPGTIELLWEGTYDLVVFAGDSLNIDLVFSRDVATP
ncbi:MAG TPA: hypothetical protein VMP00_05955, partial [Burkholderiales bacterium]|nr:hypothetical protein [Burkholderiales bacterium]